MARRRFTPQVAELFGVAMLFLAGIAAGAVLTFHPHDPSWWLVPEDGRAVANAMGRAGATLAEGLVQLFGVAALLVPIPLAALGWARLRGRPPRAAYGRLLGHGVWLLGTSALLHLLYREVTYRGVTYHAGGYLGARLGAALAEWLHRPAAAVLAALVALGAIVVTTGVSLGALGASVRAPLGKLWPLGRRLGSSALRWLGGGAARAGTVVRELARRLSRRRSAPAPSQARAPQSPAAMPPGGPPGPRPSITLEREIPAPESAKPRAEAPSSPKPWPRQAALPLAPTGGYALPPLELLHEPEPQTIEGEKELLERARQLTEKFQEFAIHGTVVAIHPGPVVTTFEFRPEAGVKYSKITALADDLCLALKAESVRIDRMPGRSTVGIEVPNRKQEIIYPRELLASERFQNARSKLSLALGKTINGEVFVADLARMPHLLIAGATGAGKSVALNGMIASILYKATPEDVRFILIDTKRIELGVYADIPHLLIPVVTDPKQASTALKWAVREMESRYRQLAAAGVRHLEQFNERVEKEPHLEYTDERTGRTMPLRRLPHIVIVIDEMADLMLVAAPDVEESVMRLAQMARAVGIHLILATQRPSVDVITGTIKANFPARIAFRVSQRVDSRTIIDQMGAEQLLGRGDMLFLPSGSSRLIRLHGGFITEAELSRLTTFLKRQAKPLYDERVLREQEEAAAGELEEGERDPLYLEAVRLVLQEGQCSITLLQRRMRLGYARAARIVDRMEREGIVGRADGSRPRELLVGPEILETLEARR